MVSSIESRFTYRQPEWSRLCDWIRNYTVYSVLRDLETPHDLDTLIRKLCQIEPDSLAKLFMDQTI